MHDFQKVWNRFHAGHYPVGYMLREMAAPNWLRFHSLPGSKRYAGTDLEQKTLLARQNELAGEVLGPEGECWLVQVFPGPGNPFDAASSVSDGYDLSWTFNFFIDDNFEKQEWKAYAGLTPWISGKFDNLLFAIADERAPSTLWTSAETGSVFAPYDGGIDLFLPNQEAVLNLKAKHPGWLSSHPQGL